jgi:FixJ family two-component response regulator
MPGPTGLVLQDALASRPDSLPIIFLSGHADVPATVQAMKAGAVDFLTKPVKREALLDAIQRALARDAESRAARERLNAWRARYNSLTLREIEVLERIVSGRLNKEIAAELGTSERTIKAHRAQVMQKMNVTSVAELVRIADALCGSAPPAPPRA